MAIDDMNTVVATPNAAPAPLMFAGQSSGNQKVTLSIEEVMSLTGLSRQTVYDEINGGRLASFKLGRRRLISRTALESWVSAMERHA
jgi:excisionase family DNA binding protein